MRRRAIIMLVAATVAMALPEAAFAHNSGHRFLPTGDCVDVGSGKEAPLVPEANPMRNDEGQLDLIEGPGDQYGARFAAGKPNTPILPAGCP